MIAHEVLSQPSCDSERSHRCHAVGNERHIDYRIEGPVLIERKKSIYLLLRANRMALASWTC